MHFLLHILLHFCLHMSIHFYANQIFLTHNRIYLLSSPRQTIPDTQRPIPHLPIRILLKSRQLSRPAPEIRLHLLPIQKRIISSYDPPFHQKCRCSCHKRRCERSSTHHCHPSANCCRPYVHSRCHKIRFRPFILPGISSS